MHHLWVCVRRSVIFEVAHFTSNNQSKFSRYLLYYFMHCGVSEFYHRVSERLGSYFWRDPRRAAAAAAAAPFTAGDSGDLFCHWLETEGRLDCLGERGGFPSFRGRSRLSCSTAYPRALVASDTTFGPRRSPLTPRPCLTTEDDETGMPRTDPTRRTPIWSNRFPGG